MYRFFRKPHRLAQALLASQHRQRLFRLTSQSPSQVQRQQGFNCSDPYADCDPIIHTSRGGLSDWISTTTDVMSLLRVSTVREIYVYAIVPQGLTLHRVDYSDLRISHFSEEHEVLVHHQIPLVNILESHHCVQMNKEWFVINSQHQFIHHPCTERVMTSQAFSP